MRIPATASRSIPSPLPSIQSSLSRNFTSSALSREQQQQDSTGNQPAAEEAKKIEPRLSLTFTCSVDGCGHRSSHEFSKRSYEKGIILIQCPGCKNRCVYPLLPSGHHHANFAPLPTRHLIADHLGWFKDSHEPRTVEEMVKAHGGRIRKGSKYAASGEDQGETIEIEEDSHPERGLEK
jgi:mitochondrial protein import protein ZIM17